ncbi:hypothetical protein QYF36_021993 [Acer negundo]|nr:hypothetical protein QYF36_021993 [Acer negundo]
MVAPAVDEPDLKQTLVRQASWSSCTSSPPAVHFPTEAAIWLYERIVHEICSRSAVVDPLTQDRDTNATETSAVEVPWLCTAAVERH